jgi:hypothetical protein
MGLCLWEAGFQGRKADSGVSGQGAGLEEIVAPTASHTLYPLPSSSATIASRLEGHFLRGPFPVTKLANLIVCSLFKNYFRFCFCSCFLFFVFLCTVDGFCRTSGPWICCKLTATNIFRNSLYYIMEYIVSQRLLTRQLQDRVFTNFLF